MRVHPLFRFQHSRKALLEVLQSPLFMAYHDGRPFNENHLRPCPMLENPELLREMIAKVGGFPFYKRPKTLHRPKGSFTNPQGIYLVGKKDFAKRKVLFSALTRRKRYHQKMRMLQNRMLYSSSPSPFSRANSVSSRSLFCGSFLSGRRRV